MTKNKSYRILCLLLVVALLISSTMAYFTDKATVQTEGTTGTVALSIDSAINLLNADGQDILNPGDMRDAGFTVTNEGNKSVDVRTTIALTVQSKNYADLVFTGDGETQSEYDLYERNDVVEVPGYGYQPVEGAKPLQVKSIDQDVITYIVPEYSLNGNSDKYDEVETIEGVTEFKHFHDYVFVFKGEAGNEWQDSSVSIDVLVEAKQHENTGSWEVIEQESFVSGSIDKESVKGENIITGEPEPVDPNAPENETGGTITPDGNGTITFSLIDADADKGIPGARMTLMKVADNQDVSLMSTRNVSLTTTDDVVGTIMSDENGEGRFENLPMGEYYFTSTNFKLTSGAKGLALKKDGDTAHYQYYGRSAKWVCELTGQVVLKDGTPVTNQRVSIYDNKTDKFVVNVTTDNDGRFSVYPMTEGDYEAKIPGYKPVYGDELTIMIEKGKSADVLLTVVPESFENTTEFGVLEKGTEFKGHIFADATEIHFVDYPVPASARDAATDVSEVKDRSILAWMEGTKMMVAHVNGGKIYANEDCSYMFHSSDVTKISFGPLDTSNTTNMSNMFGGCEKIKGLNLTSFDTSNVEYMDSIFVHNTGVVAIYVDDSFDVSNVKDKVDMFYRTTSLTGPTGLKVGSVDTGTNGFENIANINYKTGWLTYSEGGHNTLISGPHFNSMIPTGTTELYIGNYKSLIPTDESQWIDFSVAGDNSIVGFLDGTKLYVTSVDGTKMKATNTMYGMFSGNFDLTIIHFSNIDTSTLNYTTNMFNNTLYLEELEIDCFDTSNVISMKSMFYSCKRLKKLDIGNFDTSEVTDMSEMFYNCNAATMICVSSFNTSKVTSMSHMFYNCDGLYGIDVTSFDTSNVTTMNSIFTNCEKLRTIYVSDKWSLTKISTNSDYSPSVYLSSKVVGQSGKTVNGTNFGDKSLFNYKTGFLTYAETGHNTLAAGPHFNLIVPVDATEIYFGDYSRMIPEEETEWIDFSVAQDNSVIGFMDGSKLYITTQDGSVIKASGSLYQLFQSMTALTKIVFENIDTSDVANMSNAFYGCTALETVDMSCFDTSKVEKMDNMLYNCKVLTTIYAGDGWTTDAITSTTKIGSNCSNLVGQEGYTTSSITKTNMNWGSTGVLTYK